MATLKELLRAVNETPRQPLPRQSASAARKYLGDTRLDLLTMEGRQAIAEAVRAVEAGLYSSAIVIAWGALVDCLHEVAWQDQFHALNAHLSVRRKPKSRDSIRDVRDYDFLAACHEAGILGSAQHGVLDSMLKERNRAGHVGFQKGTEAYATQFIERVLVEASALPELPVQAGKKP